MVYIDLDQEDPRPEQIVYLEHNKDDSCYVESKSGTEECGDFNRYVYHMSFTRVVVKIDISIN